MPDGEIVYDALTRTWSGNLPAGIEVRYQWQDGDGEWLPTSDGGVRFSTAEGLRRLRKGIAAGPLTHDRYRLVPAVGDRRGRRRNPSSAPFRAGSKRARIHAALQDGPMDIEAFRDAIAPTSPSTFLGGVNEIGARCSPPFELVRKTGPGGAISIVLERLPDATGDE